MKHLLLIIGFAALMGCKKEDVTPPPPEPEPSCTCIEYVQAKNASTNYEWVTISETPVVHPSCQDSVIESDIQIVGALMSWYLVRIGCEE